MQSSKKPVVAIIGLGNIGKTVATNLVKSNRPVILAGKNLDTTRELAEQLGDLAQPMEVGAAIQAADIVVLAVWFSTIKELFYQYGSVLEGKIIVDPSNAIAPNDKGGFDKIIAESESAGVLNAELLPSGAKLAKALGTLGAASLSAAAFQEPEPAVLFYATSDEGINGEIEQLIHDTGFNPLPIGGIDQSIRIEVFGDLHEFGALGKPVTLDEAKSRM